MNATLDRDGTITITYNMQGEALDAPNGQRYLPCAGDSRIGA